MSFSHLILNRNYFYVYSIRISYFVPQAKARIRGYLLYVQEQLRLLGHGFQDGVVPGSLGTAWYRGQSLPMLVDVRYNILQQKHQHGSSYHTVKLNHLTNREFLRSNCE